MNEYFTIVYFTQMQVLVTMVRIVDGNSETDAHVLNNHHGIYIRWYLINRCVRKEQSLLFNLYKSFD